jgi:hypothetical protein
MKTTDEQGRIFQTFYAVYMDGKQLTTWRTCKLKTLAALHRSSHHTNKEWTKPKLVAGVIVHQPRRGAPPVRDRSYNGAKLVSRVFVSPAREKQAA